MEANMADLKLQREIDNLPLLARDYLATLHATQTGTDQDELYTVLVYLHDLITFDEKENGGK